MIDTHTSGDMLVKMKASIAQLSRFKDEFEKVKQLYEERRLDTVSELAEMAHFMDKFWPDGAKDMVREMYWNHLDINTKDIAQIFRLASAQSVSRVAGPAYLKYRRCKKCDGAVYVNSRAELQAAQHHCHKCEEKERAEIEAESEKRRLAEEQQELDREREYEQYLALITPPDPDGNRISASELRSMPYKEYLQTQHWKDTRYAAFKRSGFSCQLCNSKKPLQVHHRTYERRGCEMPSDLIVLCADCHHHFHHRMNAPEEATVG